MLRHVVTYSTRHCCSFCRWRELTILLQAAAPSVPGCPSVLQRRWPLVPLQPRQGTGLGRGSPARLRQSWQQSGGCPAPQCSSVLHISQPQILFSSLASPKLLLPAALQASWKGSARTPQTPQPPSLHVPRSFSWHPARLEGTVSPKAPAASF